MGLASRPANASNLQVNKIGQLLKDWKLIPQDHVIDESIMFGILDKDRDDVFSFEDFVNGFPRYDTSEVDTFMKVM